MNWLRRNARESRNQDPFQFLNVTSPQTLLANCAQSELRRSKKQLVTVGVLIAIVLTAIALLISMKIDLNFGKTPSSYAYFEIKAIDEEGRPVAGAQVKRSGMAIGVTDSFGEWRRYIQVDLGENLVLHFSKTKSNERTSAERTLPVPRSKPPKGDIEIYSTVQLRRDRTTTQNLQENIVTTKPDNTQNLKVPHKQEKVLISVDQDLRSNEPAAYTSVKNQVLSYVNKFISEDSSQFRHNCSTLTMGFIPYQSTHGFVEVKCSGTDHWSVLRNIESSRKVTASKIFKALVQTSRMRRTDSSPVAGWQKLSLVFTGNIPNDARIYVSGYPVSKTEDGYWHYWGQRSGSANLTLVTDKRVDYRQRITNNPYGARYINLPHKSFAKRP